MYNISIAKYDPEANAVFENTVSQSIDMDTISTMFKHLCNEGLAVYLWASDCDDPTIATTTAYQSEYNKIND